MEFATKIGQVVVERLEHTDGEGQQFNYDNDQDDPAEILDLVLGAQNCDGHRNGDEKDCHEILHDKTTEDGSDNQEKDKRDSPGFTGVDGGLVSGHGFLL